MELVEETKPKRRNKNSFFPLVTPAMYLGKIWINFRNMSRLSRVPGCIRKLMKKPIVKRFPLRAKRLTKVFTARIIGLCLWIIHRRISNKQMADRTVTVLKNDIMQPSGLGLNVGQIFQQFGVVLVVLKE